MKRLILLALAFVAVGAMYEHGARAEGNSITISPAQVDIELSTTDTEKNASFTVANSYNVPVELSIELKGIDQPAGLIIPTDAVDEGLAGAVRLSQTQLIIPEQTTSTVTLVLTNSNALSPGGHYGTIVFTQRKVGSSEVSFTQAISAGLFVVKRGGQLREVDSTSFVLKRLPFQIPSSSQIGIKNIGNVHVIARGAVLVYDHDNEQVAKGLLNLESRRLLPGKESNEKLPISQSRKMWLPQRMRVVFEYRADGIEEPKYVEKNILYIPPYMFAVALLVVLFPIVLLRMRLKRRRPKVALETFGEAPTSEEAVSGGDPQPEATVEVVKSTKKTSKKSTKKSKYISVK